MFFYRKRLQKMFFWHFYNHITHFTNLQAF
nr:MAG TPA: hypothetical protein [Caudoviricetes sp.]